MRTCSFLISPEVALVFIRSFCHYSKRFIFLNGSFAYTYFCLMIRFVSECVSQAETDKSRFPKTVIRRINLGTRLFLCARDLAWFLPCLRLQGQYTAAGLSTLLPSFEFSNTSKERFSQVIAGPLNALSSQEHLIFKGIVDGLRSIRSLVVPGRQAMPQTLCPQKVFPQSAETSDWE